MIDRYKKRERTGCFQLKHVRRVATHCQVSRQLQGFVTCAVIALQP